MGSSTVLLTLVAGGFGALLLVAITVVTVWWRQERIAYQPPAENPPPPAGVRRHTFAAADGQPLYAYVIEPRVSIGSPPGLLLAFHGNADLAAWQIPWGREVVQRTGWCVMLAEYRGYGGLPGSPDYHGVRRDARAAWNHACEHIAASSAPIVIFGHSLGSAVAVELAAELSNSNSPTEPTLLLQSPFTSARDMVRIVSTRPVQLLWNVITRVHYDTRATLARLNTPIWITHGVRDWLVPVAMGRELYALARRPGRVLLVDDAGHNDVDERGGEAYWRWLSDALAQAVRAHAAATALQPELRHRTETPG